ARFEMNPGTVNNIPTFGRISGNASMGTINEHSGGGGITVTGVNAGIPSTFIMRAGIIGRDRDTGIGNTSLRNGGGVFVMAGANFEMLPGVDSNGNLTYGRISGNDVNAAGTSGNLNGGGGVAVTSINSPVNRSTFRMEAGIIGGDSRHGEGNSTTHNGGGVLVTRGSLFEMLPGSINGIPTSGSIIGNVGGGGGVAMVVQGSPAHSINEFIMEAGTIGSLNPGEGNISGSGGGVAVAAHSHFVMRPGADINNNPTYGTIAGNDAVGDNPGAAINPGQGGGGVFITGTGTFYMYTGIIEGNHAMRNGGGVFLLGPGLFHMKEGTGGTYGTIRGNSAMGTGDQNGGGGVTVSSALGVNNGNVPATRAHFIMDAGVIGRVRVCDDDCENNAPSHNCYSGEGNEAQFGGGVYIRWNAEMTFNDGTISGNSATSIGTDNRGGGIGIAANESRLNMTGGTIGGISPGEANVSRAGGGGVFVADRIPGAQQHIDLSWFDMSGGRIIGNRNLGEPGPGGGVSGGGGVYVWGEFNMSGDAVIEGNHSYTIGGGVAVATRGARNARFNFYGGTIGGAVGCPNDCEEHSPDEDCNPDMGNTADNNGGGVWVGNNSSFSLRGTGSKTITGNTAENSGGGVWVAQNSTMRMETTSHHPEVENLYITHNAAGYMGGGIFTANYQYQDPLNMSATPVPYSNLTLVDVTFEYNQANRLWWPPSNRDLLTNISFVSTSQQPFIQTEVRHPLNNYDINFRVPLQRLDFFKTDQGIYQESPVISLLEGAQFRVFRHLNPEIDPSLGTGGAYLVTSAPGPEWEEVFFVNGIYTSPGAGSTTPLGFYMDPRHIYQLVENVVPSGFQPPFGQWRITMTTGSINDFTIIGGYSMPGAIRSTNFPVSAGHPIDARANLFYIGNWEQFRLPLSGGTGTSILFAVAGTMILAAAIVEIVAIKKRKVMVAGANITGASKQIIFKKARR
ncbi:MAG: hypothetical protein FWC73_10565, partial [Defluviitaleaceae bacterium]|nr:hypothetical protein [Defluviitaleaceae bacterium]